LELKAKLRIAPVEMTDSDILAIAGMALQST